MSSDGFPIKGAAQAVAPGANQGYATYLGDSTFDPNVFLQNAIVLEQQRQAAKQKQKFDNEAKWAKFTLDDIIPKELYESNRVRISEAVDRLSEIAAEAAAEGLDPDSPEFRKEINPLIIEIRTADTLGKKIEEQIKTVTATGYEGKYDPEPIVNWVAGIRSASSLEEAYRKTFDTDPLDETFDPIKAVQDLGLKETVVQDYLGSGRTLEETGLDKDKVRGMIEKVVVSSGDPRWSKVYAKGLNTRWKNPEEFVEFYTNVAMGLGQDKSIETQRGGSGTSISINNGEGGQSGNLSWVVTRDDSPTTTGHTPVEGNNAIVLQKTTNNITSSLPPKTLQKVENGQSKTAKYTPYAIRAVRGDDGEKILVLDAFEATGSTTLKIAANNENEAKTKFAEKMQLDPDSIEKVESDGNGEYTVTYLQGKTVTLPWNDFNKRVIAATTPELIKAADALLNGGDAFEEYVRPKH